MKSLTFFNNKGGVGKTTLSVNMAYYLREKLDASVLFVDCDPQCNATQVLLPDSIWEKIYGTAKASNERSILKTVHALRQGNSEIDPDLPTVKSKRFGIDVLPGHPFLSLLEDVLSESWGNFAGGNFGAATRTHWVAKLVAAAKYDLVVFDVGPSLGALNRSVLLGSDAFVTPVAPDLFSLYSFDNLATWFQKWAQTYKRGVQATLSENEGLDTDEILMAPNGNARPVFLGYTTQEYLTKYTEGRGRTVLAYDKYKTRIPKRAKALADELDNAALTQLDLGVVPYMFSMVPRAQAAHAPIFELTAADGLNGAQFNQRGRYANKLGQIGDRIAENIDEVSAPDA